MGRLHTVRVLLQYVALTLGVGCISLFWWELFSPSHVSILIVCFASGAGPFYHPERRGIRMISNAVVIDRPLPYQRKQWTEPHVSQEEKESLHARGSAPTPL